MFSDLVNQMQANNRQIDSLLALVDNLRYDNTQLSIRIDSRIRMDRLRGPTALNEPPRRNAENSRRTGATTSNETPGRTGATTSNEGPRNVNLEEDLVFYFYMPRREETPERLSQETITQETTSCLFHEIETPNNLTCPISLELFQPEQSVIMINQCRHIFNANHLVTWFETRSTCPMCRCNIQSTEIPPINRLANLATQMVSGAIANGVTDIFNDLRI